MGKKTNKMLTKKSTNTWTVNGYSVESLSDSDIEVAGRGDEPQVDPNYALGLVEAVDNGLEREPELEPEPGLVGPDDLADAVAAADIQDEDKSEYLTVNRSKSKAVIVDTLLDRIVVYNKVELKTFNAFVCCISCGRMIVISSGSKHPFVNYKSMHGAKNALMMTVCRLDGGYDVELEKMSRTVCLSPNLTSKSVLFEVASMMMGKMVNIVKQRNRIMYENINTIMSDANADSIIASIIDIDCDKPLPDRSALLLPYVSAKFI